MVQSHQIIRAGTKQSLFLNTFKCNIKYKYYCDRICGKLFCSKCLVKTTFPVPNNLLNIQFQAARKTGSNEKEASNETADYKQMVCCGSEFSCLLSVVNACMALLREETEGICGSNLASYLLNNEDQVTCPFPCAELNDTYQMKAMRYSFVAAIVADIRCIP